MPRRVQTYHFGRLNLLGQWDDKRKFIHDALVANITETSRQFKYGFFEVTELVYEDELFVFGRLVKYKPILEGEIVNEDTHQLVEGGLPDGVVAKSEFFLHYRTTLIAYRPIVNRISPKQFRRISAKLIEAAHHNFFVSAEIQSIDEDYKIEEAVRRFRVISKVTLDLHPSNPSNRDVYRRIDERLRNLRARRMWETIIAGVGGFDRGAFFDDDIYNGLMMAADGYGTGSIQGEMDGRKITISTEDSPVKEEILPSEEPGDILSQLISVFKRIWERIR